jgi:hypothetical protein
MPPPAQPPAAQQQPAYQHAAPSWPYLGQIPAAHVSAAQLPPPQSAWTRQAASGAAFPDFPTPAGGIPPFSLASLTRATHAPRRLGLFDFGFRDPIGPTLVKVCYLAGALLLLVGWGVYTVLGFIVGVGDGFAALAIGALVSVSWLTVGRVVAEAALTLFRIGDGLATPGRDGAGGGQPSGPRAD